jgi:hypothetical protein
MQRARLVARFGRPHAQGADGSLAFRGLPGVKVYLDRASRRVDLVDALAPRICVVRVGCLSRRGAVSRLRARYRNRLAVLVNQAGGKAYALRGRLGRRRVYTMFYPSSASADARVIRVFVGACDARSRLLDVCARRA